MPKADYQIDAYRIFWYSKDHSPAHFHIEKPGHWEIRVYFVKSLEDNTLHFDIAWQEKFGPTGKELQIFREYIMDHRERLIQEWRTKVLWT